MWALIVFMLIPQFQLDIAVRQGVPLAPGMVITESYMTNERGCEDAARALNASGAAQGQVARCVRLR